MKTNQHEHRCPACKRPIWLPETIEAGIGPVCKKKGHAPEVVLLNNQIRELAREILNEQKKERVYGQRKNVHSSLALWKKNKSLVEGW